MTATRFHYSEIKTALWALSYGRRDAFDKLVWDRLGRDCLEATVIFATRDGKEAHIHWRSAEHPLQSHPFWEDISVIERSNLPNLILDLSPTEWSHNEPDEAGRYRGLTGWTPLAVSHPAVYDPAC
jgi:hypothetical protein